MKLHAVLRLRDVSCAGRGWGKGARRAVEALGSADVQQREHAGGEGAAGGVGCGRTWRARRDDICTHRHRERGARRQRQRVRAGRGGNGAGV